MKVIYSDGGRSKYFKAQDVGDCVTRAICNATGKDYKEVYDALKDMSQRESIKHHRGHVQSSVRDGVFKETWKRYLTNLGWVSHTVSGIGVKERIHLTDEECPMGNCIIQLSKHLTNTKDKVIYDTYDCSTKSYYDWESGDLMTNNERVIYSYWTAPNDEQKKVQALVASEKSAMEITKQKIRDIKKKYSSSINKLKYQISLLESKQTREINNIKTQDGNAFCNKMLGE